MYRMEFTNCAFEFNTLLDLIMTMNSLTWSFIEGEVVRFCNERTGEILETPFSGDPYLDVSRFIELFADAGWAKGE